MIDLWTAAQLVGLVFLLIFLRGVYVIWKADTTDYEELRGEVAQREGRSYRPENQREVSIVNEAEGRVFLIRRRFWNGVDRLMWWRS